MAAGRSRTRILSISFAYRRPPCEEGYYRIKKILRHRALPSGERNYLVDWAGKDPRTSAA